MEVMQKIELPMTEHKAIRYTLYLVREEEGTTETFCPPSSQGQDILPLPTMRELRKMRIDIELSQHMMACWLNMPPSRLSRYECGYVTPPDSLRSMYYTIIKECRDGKREYTREPKVRMYEEVFSRRDRSYDVQGV